MTSGADADDQDGSETHGTDGSAADEETEWRFSIDDVGPDGIVEESSPGAGPIEPEPIELEHAVFVVFGVVLTVAVLLTAF